MYREEMKQARDALKLAQAIIGHPDDAGTKFIAESIAALSAAIEHSEGAKEAAAQKPAANMNGIVKFRVRQQGDVRLVGSEGYMAIGDGDAVCFFIDPTERAYPIYSTSSETDCPVIGLMQQDDSEEQDDIEEITEIEFFEFPGWRIHAVGGGKVLGVSLARRAALLRG